MTEREMEAHHYIYSNLRKTVQNQLDKANAWKVLEAPKICADCHQSFSVMDMGTQVPPTKWKKMQRCQECVWSRSKKRR